MFATNPVLTPLSVTVETALRRAYPPTLRQAGPLAQLIAHQAEAFAEEEQMDARFGQSATDRRRRGPPQRLLHTPALFHFIQRIDHAAQQLLDDAVHRQ